MRFLSRPLLLSLRNTFRRKGRLALTLVTLTLGGAVFIAVLSTQAATDRQVEVFMNYFGEDVRINFAQGYRKDRLAQVALATPGVARVEFWAGGMAPRVRAGDSTGEQIQLIVGNPLPYAYSLRAVAIWLAVVLALAALASALPARRASRLTVRDVLAYE